MPSGAQVVCPYHDTKEDVPGVPYLLECGCKCLEAFDKREDADRLADEEGGQVVEWALDSGVKHVVVIYVPTAISMP